MPGAQLGGIFAHMRFITTLAALAALSACATAAPDAATPARPEAPVSGQTSSRTAQLFATAGRANAASQRDVERVLGAPDIARQEGAGAAWTYRLENCALLMLFAADTRNEMRLTEVHPSARNGGTAPSLDQCATEASARRS